MIHAALDTSDGCSLAIARDGTLLLEDFLPGAGRESDRLLAPWLTEALAGLGLTVGEVGRWTLGTGPGSFAGLRCGIAMVKGICLASGAAMRGVPSCLAPAARLGTPGTTCGVLNDGRCGQVLLSRIGHDGSRWRLLEDPRPLDPEDLTAPELRCDRYLTLQRPLLPPLPEAVASRLTALDRLPAAELLKDTGVPWPEDRDATERSCAPLYVRQAVFVPPRPVRAIG